MILLTSILNRLQSIRMLKKNNLWKNEKISRGAIIEGDTSNIIIGEGTEIESNAVLSTRYGGTIVIGKNCMIRRGAMLLSYGGNILLGDYCGVNVYTILYGHGGLTVGDYVQFAAHCVIIPANHGFNSLDAPIWKQPLSKKGILIENDVWVGANVSILDGVHIGHGAVIGAGSVVTDNIQPLTVNIGIPTKIIKIRSGKQS